MLFAGRSVCVLNFFLYMCLIVCELVKKKIFMIYSSLGGEDGIANFPIY